MTDTCSIDGCERRIHVRKRGWCSAHYERWRSHGDPNVGGPLQIKGDDAARFRSYVDTDGPIPEHRPKLGNCHIWTGAKNAGGYGVLLVQGKKRLAHAWAYEQKHGPIQHPDDTTDHLCRVRACVRLDHLERVPNAENVRRGESWSAVNARKTHCPAGHEYTPENTYNKRQGGRECRTCKYTRSRNRYYEKHEETLAYHRAYQARRRQKAA